MDEDEMLEALIRSEMGDDWKNRQKTYIYLLPNFS